MEALNQEALLTALLLLRKPIDEASADNINLAGLESIHGLDLDLERIKRLRFCLSKPDAFHLFGLVVKIKTSWLGLAMSDSLWWRRGYLFWSRGWSLSLLLLSSGK